MITAQRDNPLVFVIERDWEIRHGIKDLLVVNGYSVLTASHNAEAAQAIRLQLPDLILICAGEPLVDFISAARRFRERAQLDENVPIVFFCIKAVAEGAEVACGDSIYATSPVNFNQLRSFLNRLLRRATR